MGLAFLALCPPYYAVCKGNKIRGRTKRWRRRDGVCGESGARYKRMSGVSSILTGSGRRPGIGLVGGGVIRTGLEFASNSTKL